MTRRTVRPLGAGAAGLLGAGTGLAIVTIVWGAAWVWSGQPETGPAASSPPASTAEASPSSPWPAAPSRPQATPSASATAVETQAAGRAQATSPAPAPTPVPTPPVPVRATVAYEVATKGDVAADFDIFAASVARYLADPLGWPAAGVAFERVESGGQITIWLAEPSTVPSFSSICTSNLSCSIGPNIIVNELRWNEGALPGAMEGVAIDDYRKMVVNHEVGHWLGHHQHLPCPGPGELAPLMMQQSKGLDGCLFNPYPLPSEMTAPDLFN